MNSLSDMIRDVYARQMAATINAETALYETLRADWYFYRREHVVPKIKEVLRRRIAARKIEATR